MATAAALGGRGCRSNGGALRGGGHCSLRWARDARSPHDRVAAGDFVLKRPSEHPCTFQAGSPSAGNLGEGGPGATTYSAFGAKSPVAYRDLRLPDTVRGAARLDADQQRRLDDPPGIDEAGSRFRWAGSLDGSSRR
jgi:hypothetical protein